MKPCRALKKLTPQKFYYETKKLKKDKKE